MIVTRSLNVNGGEPVLKWTRNKAGSQEMASYVNFNHQFKQSDIKKGFLSRFVPLQGPSDGSRRGTRQRIKGNGKVEGTRERGKTNG